MGLRLLHAQVRPVSLRGRVSRTAVDSGGVHTPPALHACRTMALHPVCSDMAFTFAWRRNPDHRFLRAFPIRVLPLLGQTSQLA